MFRMNDCSIACICIRVISIFISQPTCMIQNSLKTKKWGEAEWDKWYSDLEKRLKTSDGFDLGGNQQQWPEWTAERKKAARTVGEDKLLSDYLEAEKLKNGGTK